MGCHGGSPGYALVPLKNINGHVKARINAISAGTSPARPGKTVAKKAGFVFLRDMLPPVFSDGEEHWRAWHDDIKDLVVATKPNLRALLSEIEQSAMPIDDFAF